VASPSVWLTAIEQLAVNLKAIDPSSFDAAVESIAANAFDLADLNDVEKERAYAALTFVAARHLASQSPVHPTLPLELSVPLLAIARDLDRKPTLTYGSYVLSNWLGEVSPHRVEADDVVVPLTFTDTESERWFIAIHIAIESLAPDAVSAVSAIHDGLSEADVSRAVDGLEVLQEVVHTAATILPTMLDRLDPEVFRGAIRPYLFGFADVRFAGCGNELHTYTGESGAQSGLFRYIDALVKPASRTQSMRETIASFVSYAPAEHQTAIHSAARIGALLQTRVQASERLRIAQDVLRLNLRTFRTRHLDIVKTVIKPSDGPTGTGGTSYNPWLSELVSEAGPTAG
jgi:indoleamine 2,3-dioxygenase